MLSALKHFRRPLSTGLKHTKIFSLLPEKSGIENFVGVAQVPIGLAGPLTINGEHAMGEFKVPLATTEGTLVASYSRGMKALSMSGGVKTTVLQDRMQRAPLFAFNDAREARVFVHWVKSHEQDIARAAESTSKVVKLQVIDPYMASKLAFLRFNYYTGDAAGQNMVTSATSAACRWILDNFQIPVASFHLDGNMATDKKPSAINMLHTRGKRVVAEAVIKREVMQQLLRSTPEKIFSYSQLINIGSTLAGVNNNGLHSVNGIAAIFIATGQDVANVAEASNAIYHTELTKNGDLYASITIPSLIVATHGGGTGLPTQRECLELLGCAGPGTVYKFAEIVAGTVLAGELSLQSAILADEWVSSHEKYGRHR